MTLKEYFSKKQPISDKTIKDTCYYQDVAVIKIGNDDLGYGAIKIAHVGENLWAFGYEIKMTANSKPIYKDCTSNDITKGCINNLVYGMTQVLALHFKGQYKNNKLKKLVCNSVDEAAMFYNHHAKSNGKITI